MLKGAVVFDDMFGLTRCFGVDRHRIFSGKRKIAFNTQSELATNGADFDEIDITEFGIAHAEIAETEGKVIFVGIDFADEPCALCIRRKEFYDRRMVLIAIASVGY